jgi:uncharacterized protein
MKQILHHITTWKTGFQGLILSLLAIALATLVAVAPAGATGVYQMPILHAGDRTWTLDDAEVLSRLTEGNLSKALSQLQQDTGNEVRLVTIRRLDYGETIDSFTEKLFDKWFPTPEEAAHQTLLIVDTLTNNSAIRTGEEIQSLLTPEIAASVAQETLQVPLREGDKYNQALSDASDRLIAVLSGQPDPGPPIVDNSLNIERTFATAEETDTGNATLVVIVLLVLATVIPMATYYFYQGGFLQ